MTLKKFLLYFGVMLIIGAVLTGFIDQGQQSATKSTVSEPQADKSSSVYDKHVGSEKEKILKGTSEVIAATKELKKLTELQAENSKEINKLGEEIEKKWDRIEKKVEETYPQDYINIEKSLYPLIAAAKKDNPSKEELRNFSKQTLDKLNNFKQQL